MNSPQSQLKISRFHERLSLWLGFATLAFGILLRFVFLDADPYYYEWAGYITDEGRWVSNARSGALFGELFVFEPIRNLHFFCAPLFQLTNFFIFKLAGVSILTSRFFTAMCGSSILVLFWLRLRRVASPQALLLGVTFLCFQMDLVMMSRVAVPEMVIMFFQILIYFIITSNGKALYRMLLAGLLLFLSMGMKVSMLPFLAIYSAIILFMPQHCQGEETKRQPWRDLLAFWIGFLVPIILSGFIGFVVIGISEQTLLWSLDFVIDFIHISTAKRAIGFLFTHPFSATLKIWALGLWLSALAWLSAGSDEIDLTSKRYCLSSAIWFALYFALMLLLSYFPTRYKIHILIPMAVNIAVGISLFQRVSVLRVIESFAKAKRLGLLLWITILGLPTAAFISPLFASAIAWSAADPGRLRIKLPSLVISFAAMAYAASRGKNSKLTIAFYLTFPLIATTAWLLLKTSGVIHFTFYPSADTPYHAAWWSLFLLIISAISIPTAKAAIGWGRTGIARCTIAFSITYMMISLIGIAPGYIDPQYTLRDVSRDIGRSYAGERVFTVRAETLFNNNSLRYSTTGWNLENTETGDILVVALAHTPPLEDALARKARKLHSYDLYLSPEYYRLHPHTVWAYPRGEILRVFKIK
jgi:hypothetical protein